MIKSAIFDIDGTLLDSSPMWEELGERFLLAYGVKPHRGLSDRLLRLSLKDGAALLSREYTVDMSAEEILAGLKRIISDVLKLFPTGGRQSFCGRFPSAGFQ